MTGVGTGTRMLEINVSSLTESEREMILEVLKRDEQLRHAEDQRVKKLKLEVLDLKKKGAKRSSGKYSERSCGRCQQPLGRLATSDGQCQACKHQVCRNCRSVRTNGAWVCSVCASEADLKKSSGDWFYDQRVNRFSKAPGREIVRASLKSRPPVKKRETAGEVLLNSVDLSPAAPVPRPRLKDVAISNRGQSGATEQPEVLQQRSDTESTDKTSLNSQTGTESSRGTPVLPRKGNSPAKLSPAGSDASNRSVPPKPSRSHSPTPSTETSSLKHNLSPATDSLVSEDDNLFKRSVRRVHRLSGASGGLATSVLDLRDGGSNATEGSMGDRSKSVPGLNVTDDEEDEDIDNLVKIHRRTVADSNSSLRRNSKSTLGSMMSVYSEAGDYDTVEVSGEIMFSVGYEEHTQILSVLVKECRGLAYANSAKQRTNPYVKCYLLPDKSRQSKKKTAVKQNTTSPAFNEILKYTISRSQLVTRTLQLSVWHYDRFGRNAFLGEVEIPLDCHDVDAPHEQCVALRGKAISSQSSAFAQYKGELVISLKYITPKKPPGEKPKGKKGKTEEGAELHVLIKEAKNLTAMKSGGTSDSFVKGYLLPSKNKSTKRKTTVVKKSLNPHYDHTFVYKDVTLEQLKDMCLELTIWDREALSSNDFLGGVRLSAGNVTLKSGHDEWVAESSEDEVSLWQRVMQYPDSWAEGTLPLRATMGKSK
ncbi:synaptotagmin-like protein 4 isoform X2 [Denticeps clupeoides]|uniref:Synaptotagmin-like protein 4 n=1 Tax=Denticeps clupeoides TaxID=299321 RepID=A0AAY4BZ21_9TELE|nr:synaptotagmin-like protein 4 isoform X2 [Denticeps clupeoides]